MTRLSRFVVSLTHAYRSLIGDEAVSAYIRSCPTEYPKSTHPWALHN